MFEQAERFPPWKRFLLGSLVIILIAASVAVLTAFSQRQDLVTVIRKNAIPDIDSDLTGATGGPRTILLIGSDRRKGDKKFGIPARSDTMMLVRLDPDLETTNVLSMPRDLKVSIPGRGITKINEAYGLGGTKLVIKTITQATGLKINHVVNIDFAGFTQAVDRIGCVYVDVDRRYFNNNVGRYQGDVFAAINIKAGYQKLCGKKALDFVRFRHEDTDIVRGARQQSFLRQAKQQVGVTELFANAKALKKIVASNTRTDSRLAHGSTLQRVLTLGVKSAGKPIYQVQIPRLEFDNGPISYVIASEAAIKKAARVFREGPPSARTDTDTDAADGKPTRTRKRKRSKKRKNVAKVLANGIIADKDEGVKQAVAAGFGIRLPVYYPTVRLAGASYDPPRSYRLTSAAGKRASAYRIVVETRDIGEYYGIQGVNWQDPPILKSPSETRKLGGRKFRLYYEGNKLGLVAFQRDGASYWVSNTLSRKLTDRQMLAIAGSLRRRK